MDHKFTVSVGRGWESDPFMSHSWDKQEHQIKYFAIGSFHGSSAEWKIQSSNQPSNLNIVTGEQYSYYSIAAAGLPGTTAQLNSSVPIDDITYCM